MISSGAIAQSSFPKDTIYLKFENDAECFRRLKFYYPEEKGIVFNLMCKGNGSLLYESYNQNADTLSIEKLNNYCITTMEEVEQKVQHFRKETYKKWPPHKDDKLYQAYDKNDLFVTYLIEMIHDKQFVIYPVKWRNQHVEK